MAELLPTLQAKKIRESLTDYLGTTFALTEPAAKSALDDFLSDPHRGIFKGPFLRARMPFGAASAGWEDSLDITSLFPPYGHQAKAFERLSTKGLGPLERPQPTLITTGTGSGKTEAFLYPILDHVRRAKSQGEQGIKALILYPMNALANDQASRIVEMLGEVEGLSQVTVGLYTGQGQAAAATIAAGSLITNRYDLRDNPPDILLTNYKMLDQLLLRPADQVLWSKSAYSLQYLVLDEFHTYDGAQGTDVAMLLRRLGLALKSYWPQVSTSEANLPLGQRTEYLAALSQAGLTPHDVNQPLGKLTPVATSATLGDKGDPAQMLSFAQTVFGTQFESTAVITETRIAYKDWAQSPTVALAGTSNQLVGNTATALDLSKIDQWALYDDLTTYTTSHDHEVSAYSHKLAARVLSHLYGVTSSDKELETADRAQLFEQASEQDLLKLEQALPILGQITELSEQAIGLSELANTLLPRPAVRGTSTATRRSLDHVLTLDPRAEVLEFIIAALSHIRAVAGRDALTIELHMWVRELSRIDRVVGISPRFTWADDGVYYGEGGEEETGQYLPAIYCRHCGRSGWNVVLTPTGTDLDTSTENIRKEAATYNNRVRPLMYAQREADQVLVGHTVSNLHWFRTDSGAIETLMPDGVKDSQAEGSILPVLTYTDPDSNEKSVKQVCPNCDRADGIRSLGARIATLLSVTLSTLFGEHYVDAGEKKALVFTDSVQDAAHRAGFVQARSHALTLRAALNSSITEQPQQLPALVQAVLDAAKHSAHERYRLVPPDCVERPDYKEYWAAQSPDKIKEKHTNAVRRRLLFDAQLEFGLQHTLGRTLELTGTVQTSVTLPPLTELLTIGRKALEGYGQTSTLEEASTEEIFSDHRVHQWIIGIIERMRAEGAIFHQWLDKYVSNDGLRLWIWGKRNKSQGMPAFPAGRPGFGFPRVGSALPGKVDSDFVQVNHSKSWYATWTARTLAMEAYQAGNLAAKLFRELAKHQVVTMRESDSGAYIYGLQPDQICVRSIPAQSLDQSTNMLSCTVCQALTPGTPETVETLTGGPCLVGRCNGRLEAEQLTDNFYRNLYQSADMRRIIAREHSSLLEDDERLEYENGFKRSSQNAGDPNVLVATPTLEMGIDIGDLSTVMLASLPKTVASYVQRVGRAGRQTGNALDLAFVRGSGHNIARVEDPLSVINGAVRAPATYMGAEEILRRQYIASIFDTISRTGAFSIPKLAKSILGTQGANPFVDNLVQHAETHAEQFLETFLQQFSTANVPHFDSAATELKQWATALDGDSTSGLAQEIFGAAQRWNNQRNTIKHRLVAIDTALPEIKDRAAVPNASEDDKNALRSLMSEQRLLIAQRTMMDNQNWIGALEEYGLLPNYTLLDDSVDLDVSVRWRKPDSDEFETDEITLTRGAATAIRELIPGASFYARGYRTTIQAIDLGIDASEVTAKALCDSCGYSELVSDGKERSASCPRCGSTGIADTGQIVNVVELKKVSAEISRDEALISDSSDDRESAYFGIRTLADINTSGENLAAQWFITNHEFGIRYLRRVTLTQLNLGKSKPTSAEMKISGRAERTPLFSVCEYCGKQDSASNRNSTRDHRAWCIHRKSADEHNVHIAISRTLNTQGIVLRLPAAYTIGDDFAVPSLTASVFLGLREHIGGEPDHLGVTEVVDPYLSDGTQNRAALLIHDLVPGGTGYLADLADPAQLRAILYKAYSVISNCTCDHTQVMACANCLLPFAQVGKLNQVSRVTAQKILRDLLNQTTDNELDSEPDPEHEWQVTQEITVSDTSESHLEAKFRTVFQEMLESRGCHPTTGYSSGGTQLKFSLPNSKLTWKLTPQVSLGMTQPDFVLESDNHNLPKVAIYTDGYKYHATKTNNHLADDAAKRNALRDLGYVVIAVTARDLDQASVNYAPTWLVESQFALLGSTVPDKAESSAYGAVTQGPLEMLWYYIQHGSASSLAGAAAIAVLSWNFAVHLGGTVTGLGGGQLGAIAQELGRQKVDKESLKEAASNADWTEGDYFVCAIREHSNLYLSQMLPANNGTDFHAKALLVHDDSSEALDHPSHRDNWEIWLRTANILTWAKFEFALATTSQLNESALAEMPLSQPSQLEQLWEVDGLGLTEEERKLLLEIAELVEKQQPLAKQIRNALHVGIEVEGAPVELAWPHFKFAVLLEDDPETNETLTQDGWNVVINSPDEAAQRLLELATHKGNLE